VADGDLAAALIVPAGYGEAALTGKLLKLTIVADPADPAGNTAKGEISLAVNRLVSAVQAASVIAGGDDATFEAALSDALAAWQDPPVRLKVTATSVIVEEPAQVGNPMGSFAHSSPGMILQFAIAGLTSCAQVIVSERKNRCMQRLLTTATSRVQILLGHYLAMFALVFVQFVILIVFGQIFLKLDYLSQPLAVLLISFTASLCIAALGLLIGALAKGEEQVIMFGLICMFVLSAIGGAWMPLEFTGEAFQAIGRLTPIAWGMDGFKNVLIRGLGVGAALLPAAALAGYAVLFFGLAVWRFKFE
jgi:ABC-2 type transport system permease protein